jgi:hypothetical protein
LKLSMVFSETVTISCSLKAERSMETKVG